MKNIRVFICSLMILLFLPAHGMGEKDTFLSLQEHCIQKVVRLVLAGKISLVNKDESLKLPQELINQIVPILMMHNHQIIDLIVDALKETKFDELIKDTYCPDRWCNKYELRMQFADTVKSFLENEVTISEALLLNKLCRVIKIGKSQGKFCGSLETKFVLNAKEKRVYDTFAQRNPTIGYVVGNCLETFHNEVGTADLCYLDNKMDQLFDCLNEKLDSFKLYFDDRMKSLESEVKQLKNEILASGTKREIKVDLSGCFHEKDKRQRRYSL